MLLLDVNVLIYAHRAESPRHNEVREFLTNLLKGSRVFGVPDIALSSLVRIVTQSYWQPPSTLDEAFGFCNELRSTPHCIVVHPSETHWPTFEELCRRSRARGGLVADAYLAAFAITRDDEWVTADKDFSAFPGLRWRRPWENQSRTNPR